MDMDIGPPEQVLWSISIFGGIVMCKIVYEMTRVFSSFCFKGYTSLSEDQKIEWNNRGFSTFHAILVAAISFYLLMLSDTFEGNNGNKLIVNERSILSDAAFGISIGYFLSDLGMIIWLFPALGGREYILHHGLSLYSIVLALVSGKAHFYILLVLLSEITTPFINLRWYLDNAGKKNSVAYLCNGVALFIVWLVARILLFIYFFMHIYQHFDQVKTIFPLGFYSLLTAPSLLAVMNLFWFSKIFKGMLKTLVRRRHQA